MSTHPVRLIDLDERIAGVAGTINGVLAESGREQSRSRAKACWHTGEALQDLVDCFPSTQALYDGLAEWMERHRGVLSLSRNECYLALRAYAKWPTGLPDGTEKHEIKALRVHEPEPLALAPAETEPEYPADTEPGPTKATFDRTEQKEQEKSLSAEREFIAQLQFTDRTAADHQANDQVLCQALRYLGWSELAAEYLTTERHYGVEVGG